MKLFFDFFPIFVFFIAFKLYGIYAATGAFLVATILQLGYVWFKHKRIEKMYIITFVLGLVLGAATLILHKEIFIKWKPTAIYWGLALFFWLSRYFSKQPILQSLMGNNLSLPTNIWTRLNTIWVIFFAVMGLLNIYVIYHFDTNTWVNFKLFGMMGLTLAFIVIQAIYLAKHIKKEEHTQ
jgi:intracellular septation protein